MYSEERNVRDTVCKPALILLLGSPRRPFVTPRASSSSLVVSDSHTADAISLPPLQLPPFPRLDNIVFLDAPHPRPVTVITLQFLSQTMLIALVSWS